MKFFGYLFPLNGQCQSVMDGQTDRRPVGFDIQKCSNIATTSQITSLNARHKQKYIN